MTCPTSPCLGMFSQSPLCVYEYVCVCLLVSSLNRQGPFTHQHVFLITILHSSLFPPLVAVVSRLSAMTGNDAVFHEATTDEV